MFTPASIANVSTCHDCCDVARAAILPFFRLSLLNDQLVVENKSKDATSNAILTGEFKYDPVTEADRAAETAIRAIVLGKSPADGFVGEETGQHNLGASHRWIVDPIDGTRAFITGSPLWGTLIARISTESAAIGFMDQPFTQERFWSDGASSFYARGTGEAVRTGRRIASRQAVSLSDALLSTTHPDLFPHSADKDTFDQIAAQAKTTRYGGDCYGYAQLAFGGLDIVMEAGLKPYDIAALIPIIEHAGGCITDWEGNALNVWDTSGQGTTVLATGSEKLHDEVLRSLSA